MDQQRTATVRPAAGRDSDANGRRVTRGGFNMHAHHRTVAGEPLRANAQPVESFFQTQFKLCRFGVRMAGADRTQYRFTGQHGGGFNGGGDPHTDQHRRAGVDATSVEMFSKTNFTTPS